MMDLKTKILDYIEESKKEHPAIAALNGDADGSGLDIEEGVLGKKFLQKHGIKGSDADDLSLLDNTPKKADAIRKKSQPATTNLKAKTIIDGPQEHPAGDPTKHSKAIGESMWDAVMPSKQFGLVDAKTDKMERPKNKPGPKSPEDKKKFNADMKKYRKFLRDNMKTEAADVYHPDMDNVGGQQIKDRKGNVPNVQKPPVFTVHRPTANGGFEPVRSHATQERADAHSKLIPGSKVIAESFKHAVELEILGEMYNHTYTLSLDGVVLHEGFGVSESGIHADAQRFVTMMNETVTESCKKTSTFKDQVKKYIKR